MPNIKSAKKRVKIIEKKTLEAAASGEIYPTISLYEVMDMLGWAGGIGIEKGGILNG